MTDAKSISCEFHLINAWMPVIRPHMNAWVKSITDLKMYGLERPNAIYSMVDLPEGRYLVNIFDTNTNSRTLTKDDLDSMTLRHDIDQTT